MMNKIILASHGNYALETVDTLKLIVGDMANEIDTVSVTLDKGPEQVYAEMKQLLEANQDKNVMVFCDMYGGTPFNIALQLLLEEHEIEVFTGFNLPIILEVVVKLDSNKDDFISSVLQASKSSFKYINEEMQKKGEEDGDQTY